MSFVNNITSTFDIEQLDGDDLSWYQDCLNSIENHKTSINETEDGVKLTTHFEQPTEDLCKALLNFTMNDVSIFTHGWQKVMIGSYSIMIIVGILTNLSVCWVVVRNSQARTARNLFIINMAISDLTVCCITMPLTMQKLIHHTWKYGEVLCKLTSLLEGVNLLVSSGTASAIAGDRLCLVKRKTTRQSDTKVTKIAGIIFLIWIISILAVLPTTLNTELFEFHFGGTQILMKEICAEKWSQPYRHLIYSVALMIVQYIIPISVILVTHTQIIGIVRQRTQAATSFRHTNRADLTIRKNRKTTQILLIIAGMFGIHWLPYHIYTIVCQLALIFETDWKLKAHDELLAFFFVHTFAMLSTITNPILYGWLNTNLKHLFRAMIPTVRNEREEREAEMFKLTSKVVEDGRSITQLMDRRKEVSRCFLRKNNANEDDNVDTVEFRLTPLNRSPDNSPPRQNGNGHVYQNGLDAAAKADLIEVAVVQSESFV